VTSVIICKNNISKISIPTRQSTHHLTVIHWLTHSVVVDDLGDNGNVTSGRSVVNEDDSADFDESLEGGWLLGLNVSSGCLWML
jgi:hypothetical protein